VCTYIHIYIYTESLRIIIVSVSFLNKMESVYFLSKNIKNLLNINSCYINDCITTKYKKEKSLSCENHSEFMNKSLSGTYIFLLHKKMSFSDNFSGK